MTKITFYFDVGSPYAYLAAERIGRILPEPIEWQPVLLGGLFKLTGRSSWALGDYQRRQRGMAEIERRALSYGLPAMRWPDPWPADYLVAMRAATYAFTTGRGQHFAMRAFRNAFTRGEQLGVPAHVFATAAQAGLDRSKTELAVQDAAVKQALRDATDRAHQRGVFGVPTVAVEDELFWGDDRLEDAAAHFRSVTCSI